jgi:hypothetical protein
MGLQSFGLPFLTPVKSVDREPDEKREARKQHEIEPPERRRKAHGAKQYDQKRRKAAQGGDHGPDNAGAKEFLVVHYLALHSGALRIAAPGAGGLFQ